MSTQEEMQYWEGKLPAPRNCVTIKRTEYLHLLEYKKKITIENGDLKELTKEIHLKNLLVQEMDD